jgi:glutamate carboxypeptidase
VYETARVLNGFRERLGGDPLLTFNPGLALGGTAVSLDTTHTRGGAEGKTNVVAQRMQVAGDLRTISPERLAYARRVMGDVAAASLPHTTSSLSFDEGYPPMAPTEGNRKLLAMYDQVSRDLGYGPVGMDNPSRAGAADVSFVATSVPMAIDGIGLAGTDDHTAKETADLAMLPALTKRAALLLLRLSLRPVP